MKGDVPFSRQKVMRDDMLWLEDSLLRDNTRSQMEGMNGTREERIE